MLRYENPQRWLCPKCSPWSAPHGHGGGYYGPQFGGMEGRRRGGRRSSRTEGGYNRNRRTWRAKKKRKGKGK